jgi:Tfp pilus assembly protein PilE
MAINKHNKIKGYSLGEMIVYVAIMSITCMIIANTFVSFVMSYRNIKSLALVDRSAIDVMERLTRDIRGATSIDIANSTFATSSGVLTLITTASGVSTTTKFYLGTNPVSSSTNIIARVDINGLYYGPLTQVNTSVTNLTFNRVNGVVSDAVKIDLTLSALVGTITETKTYHSTINITGM